LTAESKLDSRIPLEEEGSVSRGDLSEAEWHLLRDLLPAERGRKSRPAHDNRTIVNGILWRIRTGAPWRDVPEKYGKWMTVYQRFRRWSEAGVWEAVAATLAQAMADNSRHSIDSTTVRGHVSAAGANVWPAPSASAFG
jgi:transposase